MSRQRYGSPRNRSATPHRVSRGLPGCLAWTTYSGLAATRSGARGGGASRRVASAAPTGVAAATTGVGWAAATAGISRARPGEGPSSSRAPIRRAATAWLSPARGMRRAGRPRREAPSSAARQTMNWAQ